MVIGWHHWCSSLLKISFVFLISAADNIFTPKPKHLTSSQREPIKISSRVLIGSLNYFLF